MPARKPRRVEATPLPELTGRFIAIAHVSLSPASLGEADIVIRALRRALDSASWRGVRLSLPPATPSGKTYYIGGTVEVDEALAPWLVQHDEGNFEPASTLLSEQDDDGGDGFEPPSESVEIADLIVEEGEDGIKRLVDR